MHLNIILDIDCKQYNKINKGGNNMKKKRLVRLSLASVIGMIVLAGCNLMKNEDEEYDPRVNENEDVYGPPMEDEDFDASLNEQECVYGPPEFFE